MLISSISDQFRHVRPNLEAEILVREKNVSFYCFLELNFLHVKNFFFEIRQFSKFQNWNLAILQKWGEGGLKIFFFSKKFCECIFFPRAHILRRQDLEN